LELSYLVERRNGIVGTELRTINVTRPKNIICLLTKTHYVTLDKYIYGYITLSEEIFYQLTASDVLPLEPVQVKADPEESLPLPEYASEILEFVMWSLKFGLGEEPHSSAS
jgi:hypothetical protein